MLRLMNKKLKLNSYAAARTLRSKKTHESSESSEEASPYFADKQLTSTKTRAKKRAPITIEEDETEEDKKINIEDIMIPSVFIERMVAKKPADAIEEPRIKTENIEQSEDVIDVKHEEIEIEDYNIDPGHVEDIKDEQESQWMPPNWEIVLKNIREMRKHNTAPVDELGCHKCKDPNASPAEARYQSLMALILSSQTKDQVTHAAMKRLNTYGCKPDIIAQTPNDVLGKLIYPVGFWKKKIDYMKRTSVILLDKYKGDIPKTIKELCDLPGVGPKMAHICMNVAWGEVSGIGVDTHVHRISNRLGWVRQPTKLPEKTRNELEDWLPKSLWSEVNHLLVGFGQEICVPRFPKCAECLNKDICPYARKIGKVTN